MDSVTILRLIGLLVLVSGFLMAWNPELVSSSPIPEDAFKAVERRIKWGLMIGLGILLLFHHQLKPWLLTVSAVGASLTFGMLTARVMGIVLDGSTLKQWYWVSAECVAFAGLLFWYFKQSA